MIDAFLPSLAATLPANSFLSKFLLCHQNLYTSLMNHPKL
jgi:hypothetical protein